MDTISDIAEIALGLAIRPSGSVSNEKAKNEKQTPRDGIMAIVCFICLAIVLSGFAFLAFAI